MPAQEPLRVLHLITWLVHGGIEKWLLEMTRATPRSRCVMDFCCKGPAVGWRAGVARDLGATVWHCPLRPPGIGFIRRLKQILAEGRYDVLHVHLDAHSGLPVYVARSVGLPVIVTFHNTYFAPAVWWMKLPLVRNLRALYANRSVQYAVKHATLVTGVSRGVLESVYRPHAPDPQRSRVLYLGAVTPTPQSGEQRAALRQTIGVPATAPVVLHVASFSPAKNHAGLLRIFREIAQAVPGSRLVMVGDGVLRAAIEESVKDDPIRDRLHFLGAREDVPALMQASDVFLFPSLHEGLPVTLIEAQAAGLPIVASRIPGITEAVEDSVSALLHDPADLEGMAASAAGLLTDPARARAMGEAGRRRHHDHFTQEAALERLLQLYTAVH
jgi:glycosyltransferase involved in cell wall biosynthesis